MSEASHSFTTYAKCIVAGEHSVLVGCPALVFPVKQKSLVCNYEAGDQGLEILCEGPYGSELRLLVWGVLEEALRKTKRERSELKGKLTMDNSIPVGGGLGASAAISVAVGRLWLGFDWIEEEELYEFSRQLENLFHGESSGVDIAAAMSTTGLRFTREGERTELKINWRPQWYLSYSGQKGVTAECVRKVKELAIKTPEIAEKIHEQMRQSVEQAQTALSLNEEDGFNNLADSFDKARSCFRQWGLIHGELTRHIELLESKGAYAIKPTGSGGGGYVLSLWKQSPPSELELISL